MRAQSIRASAGIEQLAFLIHAPTLTAHPAHDLIVVNFESSSERSDALGKSLGQVECGPMNEVVVGVELACVEDDVDHVEEDP